jgi:hypothetical protein
VSSQSPLCGAQVTALVTQIRGGQITWTVQVAWFDVTCCGLEQPALSVGQMLSAVAVAVSVTDGQSAVVTGIGSVVNEQDAPGASGPAEQTKS